MKIAVYCIALNEEKFVKRCIKSCREADYFVLADTGSTDRTVEFAKEMGVLVHHISVKPWRFDVARNAALALVPADADVCVALDLDELMESGWREEVERLWALGATRINYQFEWHRGIVFEHDKIHARHGYTWKFPCHETLFPDPRFTEVLLRTDMLLSSHYPDANKSRAQYLDLLRLGVLENPLNPRVAFYFARELTYHNAWEEATQAMYRYLSLPEATWKDERAYVYRLLGQAATLQGDVGAAEAAYQQGAFEAPHRREPWFFLAYHYYKVERWEECLKAMQAALSIQDHRDSWLSAPEAWSATAYDLAAIAAYRMGQHELARVYGGRALELAPEDERLRYNMTWYTQAG